MRSGVVLACLLVAAPVAADDKADKAKAALHYKQGKAFEGAKQYDEAIAEYRAAYAIDKQAAHLYNIARALHLKGDLKAAIESYQKYLDADPSSARGKEVRDHVVALTQQVADETAKLDAAAKAKLADERRAKAANHVKQAEAYATAGAWVKAGDEHRAAMDVDGDPAHLLAAAEAYGKQPDLPKQRDALAAYLDKVSGPDADPIRTKLAEVTSAIEKAEAEARRVAAATPPTSKPGDVVVVAPKPHGRGQTPGKIGFGAEFRGALHLTASFVANNGTTNLEADNKSGVHVSGGAFADLWLAPSRRLQLGPRASFVKNGYGGAECGNPICPKEITLFLLGPAVVLEQSLSRRDNFNVHVTIGANVGFALKKTLTRLEDEGEVPGLSNQLGTEVGLGIRNGRMSIALNAQLVLNGFGGDLDIGNSRSLGLALGWSSRR